MFASASSRAARASVSARRDCIAAQPEELVAYRRLPSLREYVLISQRERRLEVYRRDGRRWLLEEYGPGDRLPLSSLAIELAVDEIYIDRLGPIVG